jgi:thioesterase domain-containing protein
MRGKAMSQLDTGPVEAYLHEHIPLSRAMGVGVRSATHDRVVLSAPLEPNINHRGTVFGGSAGALAILAAWTLLHLRLTAEGHHVQLVVQRQAVSYEMPIQDCFLATSVLPGVDAWSRFTTTLRRRRRARIRTTSSLESNGQTVGRFEGDFVAVIQ